MIVLEAIELYRFFHAGEAETFALRGVSLQLRSDELVAIMGPSGSGKSTLVACLAGLDEPDGGHVRVMNSRLTRRSEQERSRLRSRHIGMFLQAGNLFEHLTVAGNIRFQMRVAGSVDAGHLAYLLDAFQLLNLRSALPRQLSGGEAARASLAVALAAKPAVLLADEPTAEVDADSESRILALLDARRQQGAATLLCTHSRALAQHADRVIRLQDGHIVDE